MFTQLPAIVVQPNQTDWFLSLFLPLHVSVSETESNPLAWGLACGTVLTLCCWRLRTTSNARQCVLLTSILIWLDGSCCHWVPLLLSPPPSSLLLPPSSPCEQSSGHAPTCEGWSQCVLFIHVHTGNQLQQFVQGRYGSHYDYVCVCRYLYTSSSLVWVSSGSGEGEDFTECAVRSIWSTRHDNARIMQWASGLEYRQIDSGTLEVVDSRCSSLHTDHRTSLAQFSVLLEQSQPLTRVYQRGNTLQ